MKLIALSKTGKHKGKYFAQVDDEDYDFLMQWNWSVDISKRTCYARRTGYLLGKAIEIKMHSLILGITDPDLEGDHIDHNGLNNQRYNLRIGTHIQNLFNKSAKKNGTSKYLGVTKHTIIDYRTKKDGSPSGRKDRIGWSAVIKYNKQTFRLGHFKTEIEAALAYDRKAVELFGEWANLNFPEYISTLPKPIPSPLNIAV